MPRKDKMLRVRKNIMLPEDQQEFVLNACRRSIKTEEGWFIVPICRCFGTCEEFDECEHLATWKSPRLNAKNHKVISCYNFQKQIDSNAWK